MQQRLQVDRAGGVVDEGEVVGRGRFRDATARDRARTAAERRKEHGGREEGGGHGGGGLVTVDEDVDCWRRLEIA